MRNLSLDDTAWENHGDGCGQLHHAWGSGSNFLSIPLDVQSTSAYIFYADVSGNLLVEYLRERTILR